MYGAGLFGGWIIAGRDRIQANGAFDGQVSGNEKPFGLAVQATIAGVL